MKRHMRILVTLMAIAMALGLSGCKKGDSGSMDGLEDTTMGGPPPVVDTDPVQDPVTEPTAAPTDGTTGSQEPPESTYPVASMAYETDGNGYDEVLDAAAAGIAEDASLSVSVRHYEGYAEMEVRTYSEQGTGRVVVARITDEEAWYSAGEAFAMSYDGYEADDLLALRSGDKESGKATFTGIDADGDTKAQLAWAVGGMYVDGTYYLYGEQDQDTVAGLVAGFATSIMEKVG